MAKKQYFGTDGIRGLVGKPPITPDFVLKLAHAVGSVLVQQQREQGANATQRRPQVLIGKDTRISGYMLESALESGFNSAGVDVVLAGPLPTPGVAYLTRALRCNLGVVISASHNPFHDNGIKFFCQDGSKLDDAWELQVEQKIGEDPVWVASDKLGKTRRLEDAAGRYIEFCKSTFDNALSLRGLKIAVDAAHGAAYHIAPDVLHELGAEVVAMGNRPDGLNINKDCGATKPEALCAFVKEQGADYGIALDGDADRLQMVDADGRLYNGDELLYAMACDYVAQGRSVPGVVGTLMTNMAVENGIRAMGMDFVRAKVGDRYVKQELQQRGWLLGGEGSGHLLALDKHSTGDGIICALQVLQAVQRSGKSLAQMLEAVKLYPQTLLNARFEDGVPEVQDVAGFTEKQAEIETRLNGKGRVLIRKSGTEPVMRIMVEAEDATLAQDCAQELYDLCV